MRAPAILAAIGLLAAPACKRAAPPDPEKLAAPEPPLAAPAEPPRCAELPGGTTLGDAGAARADDAGADDLLPFAAEVGEAVPWAGGFAVGAIAEEGRRATATVALLDGSAKLVRTVSLGAAHGDVDPPRLAAGGDALVAAMVEPLPNGRALRLARIGADGAAWGATVRSPRDESEAFDLAIGERRAVLAWDEDGPRGGVVQLVSFDPAAPSTTTAPRVVSSAGADAEQPRLVARPGGFWLAYVARRADPSASGDPEGRYRAEEIGFRWLEVLPLDALGSPAAAARVVGSRDAHVIAFDLAAAADGGATLVWRDDDTPSGSAGGSLLRADVHPASVDEPRPLAEEHVGAGVPALLPGWIAVADATEATRVAPLDAKGELARPLAPEPVVGLGQPIAASADALLVARPAGRQVRLVAVRCQR